MNPILTNCLLKTYPTLYVLYNSDTSKPFFPMVFGFECGDGWFKIIRNLSGQIYSHLVKKGKKYLNDFQVSQVKEKFGTLRYYYYGGDEQVSKWVDEAERASAITCEECGAAGKTRGKGWYTTLCLRHWKEYKKKLQ